MLSYICLPCLPVYVYTRQHCEVRRRHSNTHTNKHSKCLNLEKANNKINVAKWSRKHVSLTRSLSPSLSCPNTHTPIAAGTEHVNVTTAHAFFAFFAFHSWQIDSQHIYPLNCTTIHNIMVTKYIIYPCVSEDWPLRLITRLTRQAKCLTQHTVTGCKNMCVCLCLCASCASYYILLSSIVHDWLYVL